MPKEISRRSFMKKSAAIGVTSVISSAAFPNFVFAGKPVDISVITGDHYLNSTKKAVELLGGMERFVSKNSKVAILANPQRNNPGAFTKPDVLRAAIKMCQSAGASEVSCISCLPMENWQRTGLWSVVDAEGAKLVVTDHNDESQFTPVPVPQRLSPARWSGNQMPKL